MNINLDYFTDIGGRKENQDSFSVENTKNGLLIVVSDGMGGNKGGRYASENAVRIICESVKGSAFSGPKNILHEAITNANRILFQKSNVSSSLKGMGATVVALLLNSRAATIANVGDSRVYHIRKNKIVHITNDHSKVNELIKKGVLTREQARLSDKANVITRALGISPKVNIDFIEKIKYKKNDRFFLCTDGVWGDFPENELLYLIANDKSVTNVIDYFKQYAKEISIEKNSSHDNLTAVLIQTNRSAKGILNFPVLNLKNIFIAASSILIILLLLLIFVYPDPLKLKKSETDENIYSQMSLQLSVGKDSMKTLQKAFDESLKLHEEIIVSRNRQLNPELITRIKEFLLRYKNNDYVKK